jgi:hypothetical protein
MGGRAKLLQDNDAVYPSQPPHDGISRVFNYLSEIAAAAETG